MGRDYAAIADVQDEIPESTPAKAARLAEMAKRRDRGDPIEGLAHSGRWIGSTKEEP